MSYPVTVRAFSRGARVVPAQGYRIARVEAMTGHCDARSPAASPPSGAAGRARAGRLNTAGARISLHPRGP